MWTLCLQIQFLKYTARNRQRGVHVKSTIKQQDISVSYLYPLSLYLASPMTEPAMALQYRKIALTACLVNERRHSVSKGPGLSEHLESQKVKNFEGSQT